MNRRTMFVLTTVLTTMLTSGLAVVTLPEKALAQGLQGTLQQQLVGTWLFSSCEPAVNGIKTQYCGNGNGSLSFNPAGRYTLVILANGRPKVTMPSGTTALDRTNVSPEEYKGIAQGTVAQFGTWSVNESNLTLHPEHTFIPNGEGLDTKYRVSLTGDELKVTGGVYGATTSWKRASIAQSSPLMGAWKLNLEKSKFTSGPAPKSQTINYTQDGQNMKANVQVVDDKGKTLNITFLHIYDGRPHPTAGSPMFDASSYTRLDTNTLIWSRYKDLQLVGIGRSIVAQDGKSFTTVSVGAGGTPSGGGPNTDTVVFERQ